MCALYSVAPRRGKDTICCPHPVALLRFSEPYHIRILLYVTLVVTYSQHQYDTYGVHVSVHTSMNSGIESEIVIWQPAHHAEGFGKPMFARYYSMQCCAQNTRFSGHSKKST